ncbi:hypothetical protein EJ04DRAFT_515746 [Polyplosphaeria fusca]|uniref:Uncharacterized protein n=1 Tax=Polyplosphaeria fusca TaxID=682080 RepID=A0A9P4QLQ3_9PLEO|nr:hypothetical protein EJ04DRAFT_515746 [Polyplosphaeria fusca]
MRTPYSQLSPSRSALHSSLLIVSTIGLERLAGDDAPFDGVQKNAVATFKALFIRKDRSNGMASRPCDKALSSCVLGAIAGERRHDHDGGKAAKVAPDIDLIDPPLHSENWRRQWHQTTVF